MSLPRRIGRRDKKDAGFLQPEACSPGPPPSGDGYLPTSPSRSPRSSYFTQLEKLEEDGVMREVQNHPQHNL